MRVLFETHPWAFATPGGGERQVIQYAKHLASYDVDVVFARSLEFLFWKPWTQSIFFVHRRFVAFLQICEGARIAARHHFVVVGR